MTISRFMGLQYPDIDKISAVAIDDIAELNGLSFDTSDAGTFSFDVTTSGADTFELPILSGGAGYTQDFNVNWGDTNSSTITSYDDADRIHSYAGAGTYTVVMSGTCEYFAFKGGGDRLLPTALNAFTGDMRFEVLNFEDCSNITSICVLGTMAYLKNATGMFRELDQLTTIPAGIFDGCSNMDVGNGFDLTFHQCSNLATIPADLFKYQPELVGGAFTQTFCQTAITSIPIDLFKYQTKLALDSFNGTFRLCTSLTSIPTDLLRYNTSIYRRECTSMFESCTDITSIPADLFKYNTGLTLNAFQQMFKSCTGITSIPAGLFLYNTAVNTTSFASTFQNCEALVAVPTDLFRYNVNVAGVSFLSTFMDCDLLATVPSGLFKYNLSAQWFNQTFYNCPKLQIISDIFCDAADEGTRFLNQSINFTRFLSRATFTGSASGTAPTLWDSFDFGSGTPVSTECYNGAGNSLTSISNYNDIPVAWL